MLIRLVIENVFSFDERKEFNTIPYQKLRTLNEHKYHISDFDILKSASVYGANGAGKSNLVKALLLLQNMINEDEIPFPMQKSRFKFGQKKDQILMVEFFQDGTPFYYAVKLRNGRISEEELYISGPGRKKMICYSSGKLMKTTIPKSLLCRSLKRMKRVSY